MKAALITGASSGIGEAYAEELAQNGYNVVIVSNQEEKNIEVAKRLQLLYSIIAVPYYADLTETGIAQKIYDDMKAKDIEVDILVSNAGILQFSQLSKTSSVLIDKVIALHCQTPTQLCKLFGEDMKQRGKGHILLMSSMTAWLPYPTISVYASSKAYLKTFGESLYYELRRYGVRVTIIYPGAVDTPLYNLPDNRRKLFRAVGLMSSAHDVAHSALQAMFSGRRTLVVGIFTKVSTFFCRLIPSWLLALIFRIPVLRRLIDRF